MTPPKPGEPARAALMAEVVTRLDELERASGPGMSAGVGGINTRPTWVTQRRRMTIAAIHQNWLDCTVGSIHYNVARPALNRRDSPEGGSVAAGGTTGTRDDNGTKYTFTYTSAAQYRNVTGGTIGPGGEDQIIGPTAYVVGDLLSVEPLQQDVQGDTTGTVRCQWESTDARCWGTVPS